jgi:hypothetical protein
MDNVLEHIENPGSILQKVKRVLADDQSFVVGVLGRKGYDTDHDHKVFYSKEKLIETMHVDGFVEAGVFAMLLNLALLDNKISQYCIYAILKKYMAKLA